MELSHEERTNRIKQIFAEICSLLKLSNDSGHFDTNLFMEDLVLLLLNALFGYQLENINHKTGKNNVEGIDLIDESNKICIQVSSRTDIRKIKKTIKSVSELEAFSGFRLLYFALTDKSSKRKAIELANGDIVFRFSTDYYDFSRIIQSINSNPNVSGTIYNILTNWIGETSIKTFEESYSKQQIESLNNYYPRTVSVPAEDEYKVYFQKEKYPSDTLYNFISGKVIGFEDKKSWLLVSTAQLGKSYEAINLFHRLQSDDTNYPILIKARDFQNEKGIVLPFYAPVQKIVLIVDGFDELPENKRNTLRKILENLSVKHPTLRIVITCRRNYVNLSIFTNFQRLNLDDLSLEEIKEIVESNDLDFDLFSEELIANNLWELVFEPFYLKSLISIYKAKGCLPKDRMGIIRTIISNSYETDDSINPTVDIPSETYGNSMLSKIAYVLQLSEQKELTESELKDAFKYGKEDISRCLRFAIFKRSEDKKYSFTKNIFLNYFVVRILLKKTADEILKLIVLRDAEYSCINPAWLDVFELLIASLDNRSDTYRQLVEWISKYDQINIINLDPHSLPKRVVISTFKGLLMKYKSLRISGPNDFNYRFHKRLANHCIYRESLELVVSEYKSIDIEDGYGYLLCSMIAFLDPDTIQASDLYTELVDIAFENIKKSAYSDIEVWYAYVPLENRIFHNSTTADFLINLYSSTNRNLLKEIFSLISKLNDVDPYIDFIVSNIDDYKRYTDKTGVSHPVEYELIDIIFSKIKNAYNLPAVMDCMVKKWIDDRNLISSEKEAYKSLINVLNVTKRHIAMNPDLLTLIELTWQKVLIKRVFSGELLHLAFCAVKKFVTEYNTTDKIPIIIQAMKACLINENCGLELRNYRAVISLYLSPKDVDRIASGMDCSVDNAVILDWIKSGLDTNIDDRVDFWLNTKFKSCNNNNTIDWDKHEKDSRQVLVNHELFISTIKRLLEKSGEIPVSQYLDSLERRDIPTNTYIYWFCQSIEDELGPDYTPEAVITKAQDKCYYDDFRINIIGSHNLSIELSSRQREDLEDAIRRSLVNTDENIIVICLIVAMRYDIKLPENIIIQNLKYAALTPENFSQSDREDNFFAYAIKHVERKKINSAIQSLLVYSDFNCDAQHLLQLITYAIKERLFICIPQILKISCDPKFNYSHIIVDTLNSIGVKGTHIIKENFNIFPPDLQLYSLKYIRQSEDMQEDIISCMKKIRLQNSEKKQPYGSILSFVHWSQGFPD